MNRSLLTDIRDGLLKLLDPPKGSEDPLAVGPTREHPDSLLRDFEALSEQSIAKLARDVHFHVDPAVHRKLIELDAAEQAEAPLVLAHTHNKPGAEWRRRTEEAMKRGLASGEEVPDINDVRAEFAKKMAFHKSRIRAIRAEVAALAPGVWTALAGAVRHYADHVHEAESRLSESLGHPHQPSLMVGVLLKTVERLYDRSRNIGDTPAASLLRLLPEAPPVAPVVPSVPEPKPAKKSK